MLNLDPVKARLAAATLGPWEMMPSKNKGGVDRYVGPPGCGPICEMYVIREKWGDDMRLIANAPTDLAALVEEVERLRFEAEMHQAQILPFLEQLESLRRRHEVDQAQIKAYEKALGWYAEPANWIEQVDDRGRETIRWKWAADDGNMARHALAVWRESRESV